MLVFEQLPTQRNLVMYLAIGFLVMILCLLPIAIWTLEKQQVATNPTAIQEQILTVAQTQRVQISQNAGATATVHANATATIETNIDAARSAQTAVLASALSAATQFVNEQSDQAREGQVQQTVGAQVNQAKQQADASQRTAVAQAQAGVTAIVAQRGTAVAAGTMVAQAQQQQTVVAGGATQVALQLANATSVALPATIQIGPVAGCVKAGSLLGTINVAILNGHGLPAENVDQPIRITLIGLDSANSVKLSGQTEKVPDKGVARFFNLKIDTAGFYQLVARYGRSLVTSSDIIRVVNGNNSCIDGTPFPPRNGG